MNGDLRVVFDSNVYISALVFGREPQLWLQLARQRRFVLYISEPILFEVLRVLARKFGWQPERLSVAEQLMRDAAELVAAEQRLAVVAADPSDDLADGCADASVVYDGGG